MNTPHTVEESKKAIAQWEPHIHAFLETFDEPIVSESIVGGKSFDFAQGKPIAIKDNILTKAGHTTAGSKILEQFQSPYNATVVEKLLTAGAAIVGKANLDEFAMGSSTEYSAFGVTKNPWDISRVAGGSSGGSAAAVASGEVWGALGTDTGGSVRHPSNLCSVVGVKPTYGRVSRHGLISYGSSLDQAGPMARTVQDAALLLEIIAGSDPYDATSSQEPVGEYVRACEKDISGIKIGVPADFFADGIHPEVASLVRAAIDSLKEQGAIIVPISLSLTSAAIPVYYLIAKAEASTNLARYDGLRYGKTDARDVSLLEHYVHTRGTGFGPEVKRAILMGTYALSAGYAAEWYKQASKVRTLIRREYEKAFKTVDVIAGPVTPEPAFRIGSKMSDPLQMYLADALTVPMNLAGVPALSVPCGFTSENLPAGQAGLPVGLQVIASHFQEEKMFSVAAAYERMHEWHTKNPTLP